MDKRAGLTISSFASKSSPPVGFHFEVAGGLLRR